MDKGFCFEEHKGDIAQLEKDLKRLVASVISRNDDGGISVEMDYHNTAINLIKVGYKKQTSGGVCDEV